MKQRSGRKICIEVSEEEYEKLRELANKLRIGRGGASLVVKYAAGKVIREKIQEGVISD